MTEGNAIRSLTMSTFNRASANWQMVPLHELAA
jgi:hypothetical protein